MKKKDDKVLSSSVKSMECHVGNIEVFRDPVSGIRIYGGGSTRGALYPYRLLIIDLGNILEESVKLYGINAPELLRDMGKIIKISWRDYSVPSLGRDFWETLMKVLRKERMDVLVVCTGGHGRTGTVLSILAGLMNACEGDPVAFVRENYCDQAVESQSQLDYVEEITGRKVKAELPKKSYFVWFDGREYSSEKQKNEDEFYTEMFRKYQKGGD